MVCNKCGAETEGTSTSCAKCEPMFEYQSENDILFAIGVSVISTLIIAFVTGIVLGGGYFLRYFFM